ncbi:hypothetical protein QMP25_14905 [Enterocloster clostridioformis]
MNYQKQQVLMNIMDMGGPDGKLCFFGGMGGAVRKLRLSNPFVAKGLPSPQGMKFSIKPFEH